MIICSHKDDNGDDDEAGSMFVACFAICFYYPPVPNPDRLLADIGDKTGKSPLPPRVLVAMVVSISTILSVGTVPLVGTWCCISAGTGTVNVGTVYVASRKAQGTV